MAGCSIGFGRLQCSCRLPGSSCIRTGLCALQVPPVPSQLVRILMDLLWAAGELREVVDIDVTPDLWQVLLNHAQPDWVLPPSSSTAAQAGAGAGGAVVPWLPQVSSAGREPFSPFSASAGSGAGDGSTGVGSGGGASDGGACSLGGVPIQVFSIVQTYGDWYVQVGQRFT